MNVRYESQPGTLQADLRIRSKVAFDGGNRTIQWINPLDRVRSIPSFIKHFEDWEDVPTSAKNSVVIRFESQTFVLGQVAKDQGGVPVFTENKIELARKLVLAAIEPNPGQTVVRVETLLIALPDSRNADTSYLKDIEGTFEFERNGQFIVATIRQVKPVDETRAAYAYGMNQGLYKSRRNINGVLDLGGGTSIARLYDTSGNLIRKADTILPGTKALAQKVSARITKDLEGSPDLTLIMDGIEAGDYQLGTTGYSFAEAFESAREQWIGELRAELKTKWGEWLPSLGEVLIIGGSAPLAQSWMDATKGRFKVAPDPQHISIKGMVQL